MSSNSRLLLLATLSGALALGACSTATRTDLDGNKVAVARTPTEQFKVQVEHAPQTLLFAAHDNGLSPAQRAAASDYAALWAERGTSDILIEAASAGGPAAYNTSHAAADALVAEGVPAEAISIAGYDAPEGAPVRITLTTAQAHAERCGRSWDKLSETGANHPFANFGCATKQNLAAMIANPADIDHPRAMQPADAARRQTILDKYRAGQISSSPQDPAMTGVVAKAVQ